MSRWKKTLEKILRGTSDANIDFADVRNLLKQLEFVERIKGDHHIFTHDDVAEILNLQPKGSKAKAYQVKQVRNVLVENQLSEETNDEDK